MSTPTLENRIQALPQELQDAILEAWIAVGLTAQVTINESYKPPPQLHVSRGMGSSFAKAYYADTTFLIDAYDMETNTKWLASLSAEHRAFVQRLRDEIENSDLPQWLVEELKTMAKWRWC